MAHLSEYIKLRTEQQRELSWGEVDSNFLYVANPWVPTRYYKEGYIVYHDPDDTGSASGLAWYRALVDNGPVSAWDPSQWEAIGAAAAAGTNITVTDGTTSGSVNTLTVAPDDFNISIVGANANLSIKDNAVKWWLPVGDPSIGAGVNNAKAIHTGQVIIGSGNVNSLYKLTVYGTSYFTGNITLANAITVDGVDISALAADYNVHTHTIVPTTLTNYSILYPNSNNQLEDVTINTGTLATGHTLVWNNSTKKWENQAAVSASLSGLSDVQFSALANNQLLRYNFGTGKWNNVAMTYSLDTGFATAPFAHNHDTRYFRKTQLSVSGGGGQVHWNNVTSKPTDSSDYIIASTYGGPFTNTAYRVLSSTDGSITIDTTTPNVIDLSAASSAIIDVYEDGSLIGAYAGLDFIANSFGSFTVTGVTSSAATVELVDPKITVQSNTSSVGTVHNLDFTDTSNVIFTATLGTGDNVTVEAESKVIVGVQDPAPAVITVLNAPRLNLAFKDNTEITWTVTDQAGTDTVAVEANIATPNQIDIYANGSLDGSFTGIDFVDGIGTTVNTSPSTGGTNSVAIDISVDLNDVCQNGFSTATPIEIAGSATYLELTQPADVTNPSAPEGCIILASPNGTRFAITVDDYGNLITTQL
jgi:hypothetical protein